MTFALKSATEPGAPVKCAQCGVAKPPSGFAAHQYKRAEFWASKGKNPNPNPPGGGDRDPDADDACHWDERGDGGGDRSWIRGTRRWEKDNRGGGGEDGGGEVGGGGVEGGGVPGGLGVRGGGDSGGAEGGGV